MRTTQTFVAVVSLLGMWQHLTLAQEDAGDKRMPAHLDRETPLWIKAYVDFNHIATSTTPKVGMKLDELVKVLGEPSWRYKAQGRKIVTDPMGPFGEWYNNPKGLHVAPFIRVRIEDGVIVRIVASRM